MYSEESLSVRKEGSRWARKEAVVSAYPELPEAIRAGIVAMVKAARIG